MATVDRGLLNLEHSSVAREPSNIFTGGDGVRYSLNRSVQDEFTTRPYLGQRNLRERLQMLRDREKAAQHHNRQLMQQFEKAQDTLRDMMARTATMKTIRMEYERYLRENYPRWQQQLKIKTETAQRQMMEDCLRMCLRNTEEQAKLAAAQELASQGRDRKSRRDFACDKFQNCQSDSNQESLRHPPIMQSHSEQALHLARESVRNDPQFQTAIPSDHTSPMWASDLATGSKALGHHVNMKKPAERSFSPHKLDIQPVRLRWSSAGSGDDSRAGISEKQSASQGSNQSSSQRSSMTSSEKVASPARHSETDNRRLGAEWADDCEGDNQQSDGGQSQRSSEASGCSVVKLEKGDADDQQGGREEEEDEEDSLLESDEASLGRSTTEDEDTGPEEDMEEQAGEESDEDKELLVKGSGEKKEESEDEAQVEESNEEEEEGDDSDDSIIAPKTRAKMLMVMPKDDSEHEDVSDQETSDGELKESSDEDVERLLAPKKQTQKESEEKSQAARNKIFQVKQSESPKLDLQSDTDSFYG